MGDGNHSCCESYSSSILSCCSLTSCRAYLPYHQVGPDVLIRGDPLVRCPGTVLLLFVQTAVSPPPAPAQLDDSSDVAPSILLQTAGNELEMAGLHPPVLSSELVPQPRSHSPAWRILPPPHEVGGRSRSERQTDTHAYRHKYIPTYVYAGRRTDGQTQTRCIPVAGSL